MNRKRITQYTGYLMALLFNCMLCRAQSMPQSGTVMDSAGNVLEVQSVMDSILTRRYIIRYNRDGNAVLMRISREERAAMLDLLPAPKQSQFFRTGARFKPFNEVDMDGNRASLKDLAGKVVVINFWFVDCVPCKKEIPELNELVEEYKGNPNVVFLAWALDRAGAVRDYLKTTPFHYRQFDNARLIAYDNKVQTFPTNVVLNTNGQVIFHTSGTAPTVTHWIRKSIDYALKEKLPQ